jgi:hypothetical protein
MSTKSSIAHGPNFHLYWNFLEDADVYLELEGVKFEASENRIKVAIPLEIWEVIRQYSAVDLSFADKSDDELCQHVKFEVQERIKEYAAASEQKRKSLKISGLQTYGTVDSSQDEQIARGMSHFTELRQRQAKIKQDILELMKMQHRSTK